MLFCAELETKPERMRLGANTTAKFDAVILLRHDESMTCESTENGENRHKHPIYQTRSTTKIIVCHYTPIA